MEEIQHESNLKESHKVLLTYIRSVCVLDQETLCRRFAKILRRLEPETLNNDTEIEDQSEAIVGMLEQYIASINNNIQDDGFKINKIRHQVSGAMLYVYVNTWVDEIAKTNSDFSANQISSLKSLIDDIVGSGENLEYSVSIVDAQQRIATETNKGIREASIELSWLLDQHWFNSTSERRVILSPRLLSELRPYLVDRYGISTNDSDGSLLQCFQCTDILTIGQKCPQTTCPVAFHSKCLNVYRRSAISEGQCPNYSNCGCTLFSGQEQEENYLTRVGVPEGTVLD
ncbi:Piso0_000109 [Millerozyma farinosa CBS 7064]|uniref:Non-structural maintenance of chromosomes element 1 homolog n=1 Tax=Pichia sorbitophila (strain ATCC MYA-4447 / BCRC 22081 / CBS 7064 / NBRC 10061 / NRRL Y-12695) TaxID=559304 RepID=G8YT41_PICSO|nr:Piso0_000109 [Millerozyma farinosa CBS 7064]